MTTQKQATQSVYSDEFNPDQYKTIAENSQNSHIIAEILKDRIKTAMQKKQQPTAQDIINSLGDLRIK